jgi:hypothetical protein
MVVTTLNTRVLKTATVGNVKLPTPADRIGAGFVSGIDHYPTTFLSQGQFPVPRLPEPEPRSRREGVDAMSMPPSGGPAGPAGRFPGRSACRAPLAAAWRASEAGTSRASRPWSLGHPCQVGRDCQSPDRRDDRTDLKATPATVRRAATRTAAAAK